MEKNIVISYIEEIKSGYYTDSKLLKKIIENPCFIIRIKKESGR